jgi:hypothetical protein
MYGLYTHPGFVTAGIPYGKSSRTTGFGAGAGAGVGAGAGSTASGFGSTAGVGSTAGSVTAGFSTLDPAGTGGGVKSMSVLFGSLLITFTGFGFGCPLGRTSPLRTGAGATFRGGGG